MDERDPGGAQRWTTPDADVPDALREVLRSAAADEAGAARVASFVGRVKSSLAAAPAPATARFGAAKSLAAVGAVVAGGALVAWLALGSSSTATTRAHEPAAPAPAAEVAAPAEPAQGPAHAPAPATPAPSVTPARAAPSPPPALRPTAVSAPEPQASRNPADTLDREVRLLQAARQLLDSDPAGALRLAEQHRSRFPNGVLAQEREVLTIQALARQGRAAEAGSRADRFRRQYPGSAHADQLPGVPEQSHN